MEEQKLIDANALSTDLIKKSFYPVIVRRAIERAPTVDAKPVVYGEWEEHRYGTTLDPSCVEYSCSVCGKFVDDYMPNFCPNCGADMRGGKNGTD